MFFRRRNLPATLRPTGLAGNEKATKAPWGCAVADRKWARITIGCGKVRGRDS